MTEQDLERKLARALDHAAPDDLEGVLSRCAPGKGTVIEMTEMKKTTSAQKRWKPLIAAVLALVLLGGGLFYHNAHAVASVVSLDVNPSIELKVNKAEKVLSCTPMNEDAAVILFDMGGGDDLVGTKLDVAVNAVVGSLLRNGYLEGLSSAILVSVEDDDQTRAQRIQEEVVAAVDSILQGANNASSVYSQTLTTNDTAALNNQEPISSGKAALVQQVMDMNGAAEADRSTLSALSVEELMDLLKTNEQRIPIGMDAAAWNAQFYAGTLILSSNVVQDVDPELDDPTPHYEVELVANGWEYDYKVDAFTGEVYSGVKDILSAAQTNPGTGTGSQTQTGMGSQPQTGTGSQSQTGTGSQSQTGAQTEPQTPAANPQTPGTQTTDVGVDAAKAAALKHAGLSSGQVTWIKAEQDYDDGRLEYELEFRTGTTEYDYTVLAADGSILKYETEAVPQASGGHHDDNHDDHDDHDDHHTQTQQPAPSADIGLEAAKQAALSHAGVSAGQAAGLKAEKDYDDGHLEYEVEFKAGGYEYEYKIDGATGAILEHNKDMDD